MKKQLIIALVVCASLGTFYFISKEKTIRVGIIELALPKFSQDAVTHIVYSGKEKYVIQKKEDRFVLTNSGAAKPKEVEASEESIKELFDAIVAVDDGIFVTEQADKHSDFKVSETDGQRVTVMAGDTAVWDLIIGDYAAEGGRYVRLPTENAVFLSKARFWDITRNSMNDFREHQIVKVDDSDLKEVYLYRKSALQFSLVKNAENEWMLDGRTASKLAKTVVSSEKVNEYIDLIHDLRATAFVDDFERVKEAQSLLEMGGYTLALTTKSGDKVELQVARAENEKKTYVRRKEEETVFEISDYLSSKILATVDDFRNQPGT